MITLGDGEQFRPFIKPLFDGLRATYSAATGSISHSIASKFLEKPLTSFLNTC